METLNNSFNTMEYNFNFIILKKRASGKNNNNRLKMGSLQFRAKEIQLYGELVQELST